MSKFNFMFWNIQNDYEYKNTSPEEADLEQTFGDKTPLTFPRFPTLNDVGRKSTRIQKKLNADHRFYIAKTVVDNEIDFLVVVETAVGKRNLLDKGYAINGDVIYEHHSPMNYVVSLNYYTGIKRGLDDASAQENSEWTYTQSPMITSKLKIETDGDYRQPVNKNASRKRSRNDTASSSAQALKLSKIQDGDSSKNGVFEFYNVFFKHEKFVQLDVGEADLVESLQNSPGPHPDPFLSAKTAKHGSQLERVRHGAPDANGKTQPLVYHSRFPCWGVFGDIATHKPFVVIMIHAAWGGKGAANQRQNRLDGIENVCKSAVVAAAKKFNVPVVFAGDFNLDYTQYHEAKEIQDLLRIGFKANNWNGTEAAPTSGISRHGESSLKNAYDQIYTTRFNAENGMVYRFHEALFPATMKDGNRFNLAKRVSDHLPVKVTLDAGS